MSFIERWYNALVSIADWTIRRWITIPAHNRIARKHFGHLGYDIPTIDELHQNVSIIFVNSHRSLAPPRPSLPHIIDIGGSHIEPVKPLPSDIKGFLDAASDGAIYVSFGTFLQSSKMPRAKIDALFGKLSSENRFDDRLTKCCILYMAFLFAESFRHLKQRIVWKYEDDPLVDVPANIFIKKWMPQYDILAHPNIRLFLSHGGLFSTMESVDRGVPLLIVPFFGDQHRNGRRVENIGYGKVLPFEDLTQETLTRSINDMLSTDRYSDRARHLQTVWNDNLVHPMDEFVWWIEHVVKFKGAKHLKSHAMHLSWFSYLLIDVFAITFITLFVIIYFMYFVWKKLCSLKHYDKDKKIK